MPTGVEDPPVTKSTRVYTKEELEALKRALAGSGYGGEAQTPPPAPQPQGDTPWQDDVNSLIQFLIGLQALMRFLIEKRIPEGSRELLRECMNEMDANVENAIEELRSIDSPSHSLYGALRRLGLVGKAVRAKFGELGERIATGPLGSVIEMADRILGSLFKVLTQLEPLKELKETLESKIKYGADQEIIDLMKETPMVY